MLFRPKSRFGTILKKIIGKVRSPKPLPMSVSMNMVLMFALALRGVLEGPEKERSQPT